MSIMVNEEQVALLRQGSWVWNKWREENFEAKIDFSFANLSDARLRYADLSNADLSNARLSGTNLFNADLSNADLSNARLSGANLRRADLRRADLSNANLFNADFSNADLFNADLSRADLSRADLSNTDLRRANLSGANLRQANLFQANFFQANLSATNLSKGQVLNTKFSGATLTGACIADWHIGSSTVLDDVQCDYIFRTFDWRKNKFSGRLPIDPESTFAPGEFTQRFQIIASALETIDLNFTEGIDWQAFFQSFQELRSNRPGEDISIQGMERKGNAFVVRLEVEAGADKASIETEVKQLYANQLATLEAQYEERLRLQGAHLEDIREILSIE